jgi:transposase
MNSTTISLEQYQALERKYEALEKLVLQLQESLKWANAKYAALERKMYGASSERLTQKDLGEMLPLDGLASGDVYQAPKAEVVSYVRTKQKLEKSGGIRAQIPAHLERRRIDVPAPDAVLANPEKWVKIGEEKTERLNLDPAVVYCEELVVGKFKSVEAPVQLVQSAMPATVADQCLAQPELVMHVILQKYEMHLPYYRQAKQFSEAYGINLDRQLIESWAGLGIGLLAPVYERLKIQVLSSSYLQVDETPIRYQDPTRRGSCSTGQLFAYSIPGKEVFFDWRTDRSHQGPMEILKDFKGHLQSDAYAIYETIAKKKPEIEFLGCWAHVRRKFFTAHDQKDPNAGWYLEKIGKLYELERGLRENESPPETRQRVREEFAAPILMELKEELEKARGKVLSKTHFGNAVLYTYKIWDRLIVYVKDGKFEIDNNGVENAIRPSAVGKKNWLFVGDAETGDRPAIVYSLLGSCRRLGINPHQYFPSVLKILCGLKVKGLQELDRLTPREWLQEKFSDIQSPRQ